MNSHTEIDPFLKWAGGKRWLLKTNQALFAISFNRYFEPFLGSGAVFFKLKPAISILSDSNKELIETYTAIKQDWEKVIRGLKKHHANHSKEYYYMIRNSKPRTIFTRASRFIYLNRTCWNGLYRVNLKGEFNVPVGTKTKVILPNDDFGRVSSVLNDSQLCVSDFESTIDLAGEGDLVFADPPYSAKGNQNGFVKYNDRLFNWEDQLRLRDCLLRAKRRGVIIISTNSAHQSVYELYTDYFDVERIFRVSVISGDPTKRGICSELLIRS